MDSIKRWAWLALGYATIAAAYVLMAVAWLSREVFDVLDRFVAYIDERLREYE